MTTEQELKEIENEIKALKAAYPVAGVNMQFYVTESPIYSGTDLKIQFSADYGHGSYIFVRVCLITYKNGEEYYAQQIVKPQDGSGNIVVEWGGDSNYTCKVIASGATPGTFSLL